MELERVDDVAVLRMNAGKANAISEAFLEGLDGLLDQLDASDARAAVLIGYDRFFCAGLDLVGLTELDRPAMKGHMERFCGTMSRIFEYPRPMVAAINGHAIAGGCVLALMTDHRVMVEAKAKIGLNEVALGVGLPAVVVEGLRCAAPSTSFRQVVIEAGIFNPQDAHALGLVHELAPAEHLEQRALDVAARLARVPAPAYAQTKAQQRRPFVDAYRNAGEAAAEAWLDTWFSDEAQALIAATVERITSRSQGS